MQQEQNNGNCYSMGELAFMRWGQRVRQKLFAPLLKLLAACGVTPTHITALSLCSGVVGALLLYEANALGFFLILLHVLLDGIDGPLARYTATQSNQGSLNDSAADQIVLSAVCFVLMDQGIIDPVIGGLHVLLYTLVVGFAMIRNHLGVPYGFLVRPRFFVYSWLIVELFYWSHTLNSVLLLFNVPLLVYTITGFIKIRGKL